MIIGPGTFLRWRSPESSDVELSYGALMEGGLVAVEQGRAGRQDDIDANVRPKKK
jgi:hypothetical protein